MTDESSASTLVLVGAVLQLLFMFGFAALAALFLVGNIMIYTYDPANPTLGFGFFMFTLFGAAGFLSLVLMILWFIWRSHPSNHKTALIITGILGLLFAGFLPGLLVLIGGIIAPSPSELVTPIPIKRINYCPNCGAPVTDPAARFCNKCGASLY